jgi:leucyl aminopeptidase
MKPIDSLYARLPFVSGGTTPCTLRMVASSQALDALDEPTRRWAHATGFMANAGQLCFVPGDDGSLAYILVGVSAEPSSPWEFTFLPKKLPTGVYQLAPDVDAALASTISLGWGLGAYTFDRYKETPTSHARLVLPDVLFPADREQLEHAVAATYWVRDLIETPAQDMGPAHLAQAARELAAHTGAEIHVLTGDELLRENYPAIHAVGRASERAPCLIDLRWGNPDHPRITLVGKGVCFDTGGLNLKSDTHMRLMKKDMGGAAHALGLALMIMASRLAVRLRVLIPAVENSVSGNALRPLDIVRTRKGTTVEIGHTDAEGRVILADALFEADQESPDVLIDFATLTGAARVALGPSLPALFCNRDELAARLMACGRDVHDPVWQLPLYTPYRRMNEGKTAQLTNSTESPYAGAITAALFLQEFVRTHTPWAHFDLMAWNPTSADGRREGAEAMSMRAAFAFVRELAEKSSL